VLRKLVESPGTAPGSERFITTPVYRHSRLAPAPGNIGVNGCRKKSGLKPQETHMKLLSGGQSGVDRAVLDAAIKRGIDYGGRGPGGGDKAGHGWWGLVPEGGWGGGFCRAARAFAKIPAPKGAAPRRS